MFCSWFNFCLKIGEYKSLSMYTKWKVQWWYCPFGTNIFFSNSIQLLDNLTECLLAYLLDIGFSFLNFIVLSMLAGGDLLSVPRQQDTAAGWTEEHKNRFPVLWDTGRWREEQYQYLDATQRFVEMFFKWWCLQQQKNNIQVAPTEIYLGVVCSVVIENKS